jgi:hypothetical protein
LPIAGAGFERVFPLLHIGAANLSTAAFLTVAKSGDDQLGFWGGGGPGDTELTLGRCASLSSELPWGTPFLASVSVAVDTAAGTRTYRGKLNGLDEMAFSPLAVSEFTVAGGRWAAGGGQVI